MNTRRKYVTQEENIMFIFLLSSQCQRRIFILDE